ncbi:heme-degrading domain-containing protein [Tropicimonas aquimaris]|uniref:Heme-degrading domain-containing protein n=1 Tax=Tropicimonas aquimaris TaxID=914152 RepID=A0ABW3IN47_9RHOB
MPTPSKAPTMEQLELQEATLVFEAFDEVTALDLGSALVAAAQAEAAAVVIDIRTPDRTLFHAALPGSAPDNDHWARRKSNTVLRKHRSSMLVGMRNAAKGNVVGTSLGLDPMDFADHGGSFPIRVKGVGVIGAVTVSGLASEDDHAMIVGVLEKMLS